MRAVLFRKVIVDGVNYYQIFKEDDSFDNNLMFADYSKRSSSDYFYIDKDSDIVIPDESLLNIYCDDGDKLKVVDDFPMYDKISHAFNDKYHYFLEEKKPIKDILDNVRNNILFQDTCIKNLVEQIYLNQAIVNSNLPPELKQSQKNNILFCGKKGSGKKTIINSLEKELNIPYADIKIGPDIKDTLERIIKELLEKSKNGEEASHGIVFIHDNYNDLYELADDGLYDMINFLTSQSVINYHGETIDFRTITFVILYDEYLSPNMEEEYKFQEAANCTCRINTRELSVKDKYLILFSENGRLTQYQNFLKQYGKKIYVDKKSLIKIISRCALIDPNMNTLNVVIDGIVKINMLNGIDDVYIDERIVKKILPMLEVKKNNSQNNVESEEEYWFEKKVDEIVEKTKEYVVGQDNNVKKLVHQLVKNIIWANKEDIDNPKDYIKNVLIRGNTGTGKTFIMSVLLKYLGVPYYIADATEYTEAGYVGKDVEDMLVGLYHAAGDDLEKAERGVLVIDEIDKKASRGSSGRDVSGGSVQEALYKFAEGTIIRINVGSKMNEVPIYFNTSRLTIVLEGAFEGIEAIRNERIGKRKTGFGSQDTKDKDLSITTEDYNNYGMNSQFMRRVKLIIELDDIFKEQLIDIMKHSKTSALEVERLSLAEQGIVVEYTDDFYDALADKALSMQQGVSGIEKALLNVYQSINIQNIRASEVEKIILSSEVINNPEKVILIPRQKQKVKRLK